MKILHLADLHLGKRVNGFSLLEDQADILTRIVEIIDTERPRAVLIAGDIYDRSVPPEEAVTLFDSFLVRLAERRLDVLLISGNHDSAERVAFGSHLMDARGIHISPVYDGQVTPVTLSDEFGDIEFWLIPFLRPAQVRAYYPDDEIADYTDAMRTVLSRLERNPSARQVAVAHQFITGAGPSGSEETAAGGLDNVDVSVFDDFDYVALGHLHGAQRIGRDGVRYAGSPLKYSFSEAGQEKSVTLVELGEKGDLSIRLLPLTPRRDMRRIRGTFEEIVGQGQRRGEPADDYLEITLTDEEDVPDAVSRLRVFYPRLMTLNYDNTRTRALSAVSAAEGVEEKSRLELFDELFTEQNGRAMSGEQRRFVSALIDEIWEGTYETD